MAICSVNWCKNNVLAKGLCNMHYIRKKKGIDIDIPPIIKNGQTKHELYSVWINMKTRCYNNNSRSFKTYGKRGIKICDQWLHSFETFVNDVGERPSKIHQLDRINNDGNYEPNNVRWVLPVINSHNKKNKINIYKANEIRKLYNKDKLTLKEIANIFGIHFSTVSRIVRNELWK